MQRCIGGWCVCHRNDVLCSLKSGIYIAIKTGLLTDIVELGISQENLVEITRGLTEREFAVTAGQRSLKDGEEVTAVKPQE